jgi:hypothetical protein
MASMQCPVGAARSSPARCTQLIAMPGVISGVLLISLMDFLLQVTARCVYEICCWGDLCSAYGTPLFFFCGLFSVDCVASVEGCLMN